DMNNDRRAMILYTSGTTSRPKGVVTTHANITAQIMSLVEAWEWSADDRIVLCLPLHHVHGIVNVVSCALWSGATCQMLERFDPNAVWDHIASGSVTLFMAVPTIYVKLIAAWDRASLDGVRLGRAAGEHAPALAGNQRPHAAGALRYDGDWHGAVEPVSRRARAGQRREAAAQRRGSAGRRERRTGCPGNTGRDRSPWPERIRGILGQARDNPGSLPRRLVSHGRYCGRRKRRLSHSGPHEH